MATDTPRTDAEAFSIEQALVKNGTELVLASYARGLERELAALRGRLMEVTAVAITQLFEQHRDDVVKTFSVGELQNISSASEHLRLRQVEDIYKEAWAMSAVALKEG